MSRQKFTVCFKFLENKNKLCRRSAITAAVPHSASGNYSRSSSYTFARPAEGRLSADNFAFFTKLVIELARTYPQLLHLPSVIVRTLFKICLPHFGHLSLDVESTKLISPANLNRIRVSKIYFAKIFLQSPALIFPRLTVF